MPYLGGDIFLYTGSQHNFRVFFCQSCYEGIDECWFAFRKILANRQQFAYTDDEKTYVISVLESILRTATFVEAEKHHWLKEGIKKLKTVFKLE